MFNCCDGLCVFAGVMRGPNAYDLSDIDTTVRVDVNSLVIPINLDEIQLKSIFDIDTEDPDAKVKLIDGQYVCFG